MTTNTLDRLTATKILALQYENAALRAELAQASRDPNWNIGSQFGFERRHKRGQTYQGGIAFIDIDEMKSMNTRFFHAGTDAILKCAFDLARAHDYIFRVKQGDELVAMLPLADLPGFLSRLKTAFEFLGISFTASYTLCTCDPYTVINELSAAVLTGKEAGRRGDVWEMGSNR